MSHTTATPSLHLDRLAQIQVRAHDVDRAEAFYRDILCMRFLFRAGDLAFFDCGGVRLMISKPEQPQFDHPSSILYFNVDDLNAAYQTLLDRGVSFVDEPHLIAKMPDHELWMAFFHDSEGNMHGLSSEVR